MRTLTEFNADELRTLHSGDEPVWLDLRDPSDADLDSIGDIFGLHRLAVEDSREFGQRPKLDRYDGRLLLVYYGLAVDENGIPREIEVHLHVSGSSVLTISRRPPAQLERVRQGLSEHADISQRELVYRILDAVTDSLIAGLDEVAKQLNAFEKTIFTRPRANDRDRMAKLGRKLSELRRTLVIQRQVFEHAKDDIIKIAEDAQDIGPYLGDIDDHLWQAVDDTEADLDSVRGLLQTYSNQVQERLTVVATIFLPLTALTGFFGMNFTWLTNHIGSAWTFFGLGLGGMLASCILISLWLRRSGLTDHSRGTT